MLLICCMSLFMVGLDVTAVTIALPAIHEDLAAGISGLQWTVGGYTLVLASLLMFGGSVADRFGRKRVFVLGLAVFSAGSLLCSVAPTLEFLIACRILQAVGGAMMNPVAMAIITNAFTDPRARAQAVGVRGAVYGVSMALGPVVGGVLVSEIGWRAIFWANVPLGLIAIILTLAFIPESKAARPRRFDPAGQLFVMVFFSAVTFGIIEAPSRGWTSPVILGALLGSGAALVLFVLNEQRRNEPLVDLRFFRSIPFASSIGVSIAAFATLGGFLLLTTLYLQQVRGLSPVEAGLATVPVAVTIIAVSPLSGALVGRSGARAPLLIAGLASMGSCAMLAGAGAQTPFEWLVAAYVLFGLSVGFVNAPITNTAVSGMPRAQAGVAAALATTGRQFGQTLGIALVGAVLAPHAPGQTALVAASAPAWWALTGLGALVFLLGFLATSKHAKESARRTASQLNPEALVA